MRESFDTCANINYSFIYSKWRNPTVVIVKEPTQIDFRLLADLSVDVIYQLNLEGVITYCSPSVERMLGYSPEEVIGNNFSKFLSPTDISIVTEAFQEVISGSIENFKFQLLKKNNSFVPVEFSAIPVFSDGKISSIQGICRNISEQKQAADEIRSLKESESHNRQIIENIREIIFTLSTEGKVTSLNPAFEKITGWSPNEFIGKPIATMLHHDDIPGALRAFDSISQGEIPSTSEVRLKTKTGTYSFIEGKVNPQFERGKIIGYFGTARDVTERKRIEEELRESEQKFKDSKMRLEYLLRSCPAVIYSCTPYGNFGTLFMSENIKKILGYQTKDFNNRPEFWEGNIHPDDREHVVTTFKEISEKGHCSLTYRFKHKNGSYRWMLEEANLIHDERGNPLEIVGFWTDITERKQTEEALRDREEIFRLLSEQSFMAICLVQDHT